MDKDLLVSAWTVQGHPQDFAGLKLLPTASSINSATPSPGPVSGTPELLLTTHDMPPAVP